MIFLKQAKAFFSEAKRRNRLLFYLALALSFTFLIFLATFEVCGKPPLAEICYWLKPFKFSLSFAAYVFTMGWLMEYLKPMIGEKRLRQASLWIAALILIEMVVIFLQSIQYSDSYAYLQLSEKSTQSISSVLHVMGNAGILANTAVATYIAILFFGKIPLKPSSYLWGIRTGFAVFISSCFLGIFLLLYYGQVPPDHESFGFPFTQFYSARSNLLSLHFFGIHAIQFFPLIGFYFKEQLAHFVICSLLFFYAGNIFFFLFQLIEL